jgi:pyruvate/2-oxoglutarate dehydrogenase complex dihydrolipoamide dehydrogenase (E3) component
MSSGAVGRKPKTEGLGLEQLGVEMDDNGAIIVCSSQATLALLCLHLMAIFLE